MLGYLTAQWLGGQLVYAAWSYLKGAPMRLHPILPLRAIDPSLLAWATLLGFLLSALWALFFVRRRAKCLLRRGDVDGIAWCKPRPGAWRAAVLTALMALAFAILMVTAVPPNVHELNGPLSRLLSAPGLPRIVVMALAIAGAPLVEEFVFRGALFAALTRRLGVPFAALATTVVFAALHAPDKRGWWPGFLVVGFLGLLLVGLRVRYRSIWPGMLTHFLYNVSFFFIP